MNYREKISKLLTTKEILEENLRSKKEKRKKFFLKIEDFEEARSLLQIAAELTQKNLATHFSSLVSLALNSIFPDPYKFKVEFVSKRGTTECNLLFVDSNENEYQPLASAGYGAADVASFALRVVFWSLGNSRNTLLFDEPFKFLSKDLIGKASEMIKNLNIELNLQFIIITHSYELTECADKIFDIGQKNKLSYIKE